MTNIWKRWLKITKRFSAFLATIILTFVYFVIIIPLGVFFKLFAKGSLSGHGYANKKNSYWVKKLPAKQDISWAREQ